mmetsp:Transcript_86153/g.278328  ORF Transcript_86153/g.278328 Transcript_86153/m.278328 type:complete len:293 (-) Transcript_86153:394-1272(-)
MSAAQAPRAVEVLPGMQKQKRHQDTKASPSKAALAEYGKLSGLGCTGSASPPHVARGGLPAVACWLASHALKTNRCLRTHLRCSMIRTTTWRLTASRHVEKAPRKLRKRCREVHLPTRARVRLAARMGPTKVANVRARSVIERRACRVPRRSHSNSSAKRSWARSDVTYLASLPFLDCASRATVSSTAASRTCCSRARWVPSSAQLSCKTAVSRVSTPRWCSSRARAMTPHSASTSASCLCRCAASPSSCRTRSRKMSADRSAPCRLPCNLSISCTATSTPVMFSSRHPSSA